MSRLSKRWQVTIDHTARKQLGLQPGMIAYQRVVEGRLEVLFLPAPHRRSLFGAGRRGLVGRPVVTNEEIDETVIEAIAEELIAHGHSGA